VSTWRPLSSPWFWQRWLPACLHGPIKLLLILSLLVLCGALGLVAVYGVLSSKYDLGEVARLPAGTRFCDTDGDLLEVAGSHGRVLAKREQLPEFLVNALLAREDARFYDHHGVDVRGLARATLRNIKDRRFTQGASTLSMQLVRNTFGIREKSLHRKLLEIALTLRVEAQYSKDEILTHYLNRIYFGAGAQGISQASQTYFDKPVAKLSDAECALLVGIIRGPHLYAPTRNLNGAIEQRRQTLERMRDMEMIDDVIVDQFANEPVVLAKDEAHDSQTSYALQAVKRELEDVLGDQFVAQGGLAVITTLHMPWQQRLEREMNKAVESLEQEEGWKHPQPEAHQSGATCYLQYAACTIETKTGAVLALIGGRNFSHSRYDRSMAKRDLGSAFEPFVAAAAAENDKLVIPGKSLHTGRQVGEQEVIRVAELCGLGGPFGEGDDLFRGTVAASPREMAAGLATLAHEGQCPRPFLIREVRTRDGEVIYQSEPRLRQKISRNAAIDALRVLKHRSGTRSFTGATASERDAWTLRLGPGGSTAIWIGFDQPKKIAREKRLKALLDEFVERLGND